MNPRQLSLLVPSVVLLGAMLHGCGDGGDGLVAPAIPSNPASITSSNYVEVAGEAYGSIATFVSLGELSDTAVTASSTVASNRPDSSDALLSLTLDLARENLAQAIEPMVQPAAISSCPEGGTVTDTLTDRDNNGIFSIGDSLELNFSSCQLELNGPILDGRISFILRNLVGDPSANLADWSFTMDTSFINLKFSAPTESITFNGGYTLSATYDFVTNVETDSVTGSTLTASWTDSAGDGIARLSDFAFVFGLDFARFSYSADADYTLASTELDGVISVITDPPFSGAIAADGILGNPITGTMVVTGANNAKVMIEAQPDGTNALISLDADGDSIFEESQLVAWTTLSS